MGVRGLSGPEPVERKPVLLMQAVAQRSLLGAPLIKPDLAVRGKAGAEIPAAGPPTR